MNWNAFGKTLGIGGIIILVVAFLSLIPLAFTAWFTNLTLFNAFLALSLFLVAHGAGLGFYALAKVKNWQTGHTVSQILILFTWWSAIVWMGLVAYSNTVGLNFQNDIVFLGGFLLVVGGLLSAFGLSYKGVAKTPPKSELLAGILLAMFVIALAMGIHAVTHPFSYNPMANTNGQEVGEFPYKWAIPWQGRVSEGVVITNPKELTTANLGPGAELVKINAEEHADFGRYFLAFDETSAKHQAARDCIREVSRQQWVGVAVPKDCDMEKGVDRSPELIEVEESSGLQNPGFFKRLATMMWGWGGACVLIGSICGFVFAMVTARSKWEYIIFVIIGAGAGFVPVMAISGSLYGDPLEAVKAPVSFPVVMTLAPDEEKEVGLVDLYRAESEGGFDQRVVVQICGSASAPNAQIVLASRQAHLGSGSLRLQRLASNGEIKRGEEPLTTGSVAVIRHNPEVPTGAKTVWVRSTRDSNASVTIAVGHPRELQGLCERAVPLPGVMGEVREEALHCLLDEAPNAALSPVTPETIAVSCSLVSAF